MRVNIREPPKIPFAKNKFFDRILTPIFEDKYLEDVETRGIAIGEGKWKAEGIVTVLKSRFGKVPKSYFDQLFRFQLTPTNRSRMKLIF